MFVRSWQLLADPKPTPFVLIVLPTQTTTSLQAFKSHAKRIYGDVLQNVGESRIIGALPLQPLLRVGEKIGWGVLLGVSVVLLPLLLVAGNVFRQLVSPRNVQLGLSGCG